LRRPWGAPEPKSVRMISKASQHFVIESNLPERFPEAILKLCETSVDGYRDLFGLDLLPAKQAERTRVYAKLDPGAATALWVRLGCVPPEIHFLAESEAALNAPDRGGPHHVFGIAHEFGHLAMMFDDGVFGQGFASYLGSEVVDYIHRRLGDAAWPRPYDCAKTEGVARLRTWTETADPGTENAAAGALDAIAQAHGPKVIGEAVNRLVAKGAAISTIDQFQDVLTAYKLSDFRESLIDVTGDRHIGTILSDRRFGPENDPRNVTAAELWGCANREARDDLLCGRWHRGGNVQGPIDGMEVRFLFVNYSPAEKHPLVALPTGVNVEGAGGAWTSAYYQPATGRCYIVGRVRVTPPGIVVEDDAIGPDGSPLNLNPGSPRGADESGGKPPRST
jgi:hypothetical protein